MTQPSIESLAPDLSTTFPRSPREKVGGYVVAGRTLDKCRASLAGTLGEYHYDCPLDNLFFDFTGISADDFKTQVATGASDEEMGHWIEENSKISEKIEFIIWNIDLRYKRVSEMPAELQEFLEGYIDEFIPKDKIVYYWFDVYDIEEQRI
ncbi:MAG: DUF5069 domain-containing protein [Verrucomicrobiota bacterium]